MKVSKRKKLESILKKMGSVLVAFSGGVDSTLLLKIASLVLSKDKILAVTADSTTYPEEELLNARNITLGLGIRHRIIKTYELEDKRFIANPVNRCYFCKKELFSRLNKIAKKFKLNFVADGTSASDKSDFRPGSKARQDFKIRSPLAEAHFSKEDIRRLSKSFGLATWDKPSLACLASRIPYGRRISYQLLKRINQAEKHLINLGFRQVRVRHYNGLCRIEVPKNQIPLLIDKRNLVVDKLKKLGYNYITVDLEGYRTGSMNETIKITPHFRAGNV